MFSLYFLVDGRSLGELMWESRRNFFRKFKLDIDKPNDSPLESAIKKIIKKMIKLRPADRMSITEVVNELSALREAIHNEELQVSIRGDVNSQGMLVFICNHISIHDYNLKCLLCGEA